MPLSIPDRPCSKRGADFIVKLPMSNGSDSVMVVIDHFSKTAHFIPANETWKAEKLAEAFIANVLKLHGLPDTIVSNQGTASMSQFWTSVLDQLQVKPSPLTAFHLKTDGQVETINALLEDYLCYYISSAQEDWLFWLPIAEFSYNNTPSSSTKFSLFFCSTWFSPKI